MSTAYKMVLEGNFALGLLVWINPRRFGIWYNDCTYGDIGSARVGGSDDGKRNRL